MLDFGKLFPTFATLIKPSTNVMLWCFKSLELKVNNFPHSNTHKAFLQCEHSSNS